MSESVRDLIAWWPAADPAAVRLLQQIGVDTLITTSPAAVAACRAANVRPVAEVEPTAEAAAKAREQGFAGVAVAASGDEKPMREFVRSQNGFVSYVYLEPTHISWDVSPALAVLKAGTWPGIHPLDTGVAGASEGVWLDANTSLVAYLRGLYPDRPAILGYRPDDAAGVSASRAVPFESVGISLAEAFAAGGHVVLSFPDDYRRALLRSEPRALSAWKSLAGIAAFVKSHRENVRTLSWARTAVVAGDLEQSGEVLNLAFRRNVCVQVFAADRLPVLDPARLDVVAAVNIPVSAESAGKLLHFAAGGGILMAARSKDDEPQWWLGPGVNKVREDKERDVYSLGRGRIYAYRGSIDDPGEFALDLREAAAEKSGPVIGPKNLDLRVWETDVVLGVLHRPAPGRLVLVLTNYGSPVGYDFLIGVRGQFRRATMAQPGSEGTLKVMPRPGRVECNLKDFRRTAIVVFEE
jgi:hypothetical protein